MKTPSTFLSIPHSPRRRNWGLFITLLVLASCSDWNEQGTETIPDTSATEGTIGFSASVAASRQAEETRADGSLINRLETHLFETKPRTYYVMNDAGTVEEKTAQYSVGVFGAYTGQNTWSSLQTLSKKAEPTDAEKTTLSQYYSANFFYNQKMDIAAPQNGVNTLSYTPMRYWPKNKLDSPSTGSEYASFWAYYPYNETDDPGIYGISITNTSDGIGTGTGMGSIRYTMHPDASEQNDFMLSDLVADCQQEAYPVQGDGSPGRVPLRFHHMLAQVRLYAFIRGTDKMVYKTHTVDDKEVDWVADDTWLADNTEVPDNATTTIIDQYGNSYEITKNGSGEITKIISVTNGNKEITKAEFVSLGLKVPDKSQCVRWSRNDAIWDVTHTRRRVNFDYQMSFNNIRTSCKFTPTYDASARKTTFPYDDAETLGSATVNHYIMNPYWFRFRPLTDSYKPGERVMLNENYMYDYFEDTPAYKGEESEDNYDGIVWSTSNPLGYDVTDDDSGYDKETEDHDDARDHQGKHFNYAPGNIILAVPQKLDDNDVPNIVITAKAYKSGSTTEVLTARVTINLLQMNIKWESGFIYCYAFLDDLRPGDDVVRGPESITVIFDPTKHTDQW